MITIWLDESYNSQLAVDLACFRHWCTFHMGRHTALLHLHCHVTFDKIAITSYCSWQLQLLNDFFIPLLSSSCILLVRFQITTITFATIVWTVECMYSRLSWWVFDYPLNCENGCRRYLHPLHLLSNVSIKGYIIILKYDDLINKMDDLVTMSSRIQTQSLKKKPEIPYRQEVVK